MQANARARYVCVADNGLTPIAPPFTLDYYDPGLDPHSWLWRERLQAGMKFRPVLHYTPATEIKPP
jgi:hypothetical protein